MPNGPHTHPHETATEHYPHWTMPSGEQVSYGYTYTEWLEAVRRELTVRFRRNRDPDARATRAMHHQPLYDYWQSGYAPTDAAAEM